MKHAVTTSRPFDVIHINYSEGFVYEECFNPTTGGDTILLQKSLSFHCLNGKAVLSCAQSCYLFTIHNTQEKNSKFVFSNLVIQCSDVIVADGLFYASSESRFKLVVENSILQGSCRIVHAVSKFCSIQLSNTLIQAILISAPPDNLECTIMTVQFDNSHLDTQIKLNGSDVPRTIADNQKLYNVSITNCTFQGRRASTAIPFSLVTIVTSARMYKIVIQRSAFLNFHGGNIC